MGELIRTRPELVICLLLVMITLAVFAQVQDHGFLNYDDDTYVTGNPHVQSRVNLAGLKWAFTTTHAGNWHPVTWISYMLDWRGELDPRGYHRTNMLLHIANTLLLFFLLRRMTASIWKSAFVAAMFAVHPLHVESVAWIAEHKDVLSALFWMLTMWAYLAYVESPGIGRYLLAMLMFALGLMSKPMLVTLPFVLLLLDYWPLCRLAPGDGKRRAGNRRKIVLEKLPLIAMSAASGMITYYVQAGGGAMDMLERLPLGVRAANALVAYIAYMAKTIWPVNLAFLYPHPKDTLPVWQVVGAGLILAGITILAIRYARRYPYLTTGWLWYVGTLMPVIGLVQVGVQSMSDRYTYLPLIGLFIAVAWGVPDLLGRRADAANEARNAGMNKLLALPACALIAVLSVRAWIQTGFWHDQTALYTCALRVTKGNYIAHNNLGNTLLTQGNLEEAAYHYSEALRIRPDYAEPHLNWGAAMLAQENVPEAVKHFSAALKIRPNYAGAHVNLGIALSRQGRTSEAIEHFSQALEIDPNFAEAHLNWGVVLTGQDNHKAALEHFLTVVKARPNIPEGYYHAGLSLQKLGKAEEAVKCFNRALEIWPEHAEAHLGLASALYSRGEYAKAWREVHLGLEYGGSPDPAFLDKLSRKMPEPTE